MERRFYFRVHVLQFAVLVLVLLFWWPFVAATSHIVTSDSIHVTRRTARGSCTLSILSQSIRRYCVRNDGGGRDVALRSGRRRGHCSDQSPLLLVRPPAKNRPIRLQRAQTSVWITLCSLKPSILRQVFSLDFPVRHNAMHKQL